MGVGEPQTTQKHRRAPWRKPKVWAECVTSPATPRGLAKTSGG